MFVNPDAKENMSGPFGSLHVDGMCSSSTKTAPQGEANNAAVAAATADPVDAGNCDAGGNSSNAAPAAAGSSTRVGSGAQPHMVGGADGSERDFDKAQQLRLQFGMPSLNVVAVRKNCALVQPNAVNRSACNFAALRATSTSAHRNEAKIRDAIVVALKLAADACSYVSQLSLVQCHSGQHFHEKWRFGPLAEHAEKVVPIVLTTLRQQARVALTQVEKTFAALLEGARLQDHALLLKMLYAAISNIKRVHVRLAQRSEWLGWQAKRLHQSCCSTEGSGLQPAA